MDYITLLQELFSLTKTNGVKFGLENTRQLLEVKGNPQNNFKSIHVAGSNGKGSVCTKVAAALQASGKKVGLYTSPHLSTFRERIVVDGEMISEMDTTRLLMDLLKRCKSLKLPITFFELTTVLAFCYFAERKVEYVSVETGLGGRLDATNVITPLISIITSISLEHTEILGKTLDEIAIEKGGIIKENVPVILGPKVPLEPIFNLASQKNSLLYKIAGPFFLYNDENNAIAKRALNFLRIPSPFIEKGLQKLPRCRLEQHTYSQVPFIFDVAHNPDGLAFLFQSLNSKFPNRSLRVICGLSSNKDLLACFSCIQKFASSIHIVEAKNERAASLEIISPLLKELAITPASMGKSIKETLKIAADFAREKNEIVIVCGTFFIMEEALAAIGVPMQRDPFLITEQFLTKSI